VQSLKANQTREKKSGASQISCGRDGEGPPADESARRERERAPARGERGGAATARGRARVSETRGRGQTTLIAGSLSPPPPRVFTPWLLGLPLAGLPLIAPHIPPS
jgi:hypothetical protein